ncbi:MULTISPECIES: hypothetical protein [Paraburkholderia]|uniref:Uncharacterized protein n=1 Tax=Paraburkholderia franconis TaxID=2654983 RepID=A0A7X1NGY2_9BURK|nr:MULTISPECIES: hypothetical protein [Paraburkholderia]MPW21730.1 hypothetical protein [Paraburkholderia franconis]
MELQIPFPDSFPLQGGERDAFEEKLRDERSMRAGRTSCLTFYRCAGLATSTCLWMQLTVSQQPPFRHRAVPGRVYSLRFHSRHSGGRY